MDRKQKTKVFAAAVAGLAVAGGGAALAADRLGAPKEESQAILNDAAKQLGVKPSDLSAALKQALENRVDAAVAAGRLTKEEGAELKQRIASSELPLLGGPMPAVPPGFHHFGPFGGLDGAASYLGLTRTELESRLNSGKTLAEIAKAEEKSVDGLVDAMYDAAKQKLDEAVAAGRLTKSEEQSILSELKSRLAGFVNRARIRIDHEGGLPFHDLRPRPEFAAPPGI